jgi:hypothetical protein
MQMQLLLEPVRTLQHPIEEVRGEVIEVLADLLLEAMGSEEGEQGAGEEVSHERENHS